MIKEFEQYHGVVIREVVVCSPSTVNIEAADHFGRVNSYLIDGNVGLYVKHSSKRMTPWQFTFHDEHIGEIHELEKRSQAVWIALVCGTDGIVLISADELREMNEESESSTWFVRVSRDRHTMYHLNGSVDDLGSAKPRGLRALIESLEEIRRVAG